MSTECDSNVRQCTTINNRRWQRIATPGNVDDNDGNNSTVKFRIATYNILSDNAIKPGEYLYCPHQLRYMSSRHERIIAEIRNMQPHVVCFQVSSLSTSLRLTYCTTIGVNFCKAARLECPTF